MLYPVCCVDCGIYSGCSKRKFGGFFVCKTCAKKKEFSWVDVTNRMLDD